MIALRRRQIAFLLIFTVLIAAICLLTARSSAPAKSLLDPDDPSYRLSPPSSGEYFNVWDPANNVHESHYNGVFQRGGPFERNLHVGGGRFKGADRVYKVGKYELGSGAAARHAYTVIMSAIKTAFARASAARLARVSHSDDEISSEISALSSRENAFSSSVDDAFASEARRIKRLADHTRDALVNHASAIKQVRRKVNLLGHEQAVQDHRLHILLNNQHALARLGSAALIAAKGVRGTALRAEADASHAEDDVSKLRPRIVSLQRTHNENVAFILKIAHALLRTNALVRDLSSGTMQQIKADIESGSVRQDSLETLLSLLSKHTDQRFVKVAKEMKKQGDLVEGVHKRMDRVEDEMVDTQDKVKALRKRVKEDVEKLEKKLRALAKKAGHSREADDEEHDDKEHDDEELPHHAVHHLVHHIQEHHVYHHEAQQHMEQEHSGSHSGSGSEEQEHGGDSGEGSEEQEHGGDSGEGSEEQEQGGSHFNGGKQRKK